MTRCLDEGKLQSYFDGELSIEMMETVTSHLASCTTCAAAARELEEESALLMSALAAEFASSVPTERLRERIDAAVLGDRISVSQASEKAAGLSGFVAGLLNFGTQRTLGYASLAVVLAFAAIVGVMKLNSTNDKNNVVTTQPQNNNQTSNNGQVAQASSDQTATIPAVEISNPTPKAPVISAPRPTRFVAASTTPKPAPVKLL